MKNKTTFISVLLVALCLLGSTVFATPAHDAYHKRFAELANDTEYVAIRLKAADIKTEKGVITFKNENSWGGKDPVDTNIYQIDSETQIKPKLKEILQSKDFSDGKTPWIEAYILRSQHWGLSGAENETVSLALISEVNTNVSDTEEDKLFARLAEYNIMTKMDGDGFGKDVVVTRAQMAKILMTARNIITPLDPADFSDVPSNHWANSHIGNAQSFHYINGFEDGTFHPDESVTLEQVLTMTVRLLGYEPRAKELGGYPEGYLQTAREIGLFDGFTVLRDDDLVVPCTREYVAKVLNRALDVPLMMQTVVTLNPETDEYAVFDGNDGRPLETILSYYFA